MPFFRSAVSVLAIVGTATAIPTLLKRDLSIPSLFAYGTNLTGLPVIYGDGLAYLADLSTTSAPSWLSTVANITFNVDTQSTTEPWTVASSSFNSTPTFYIYPDNSAFNQAGFVDLSSNGTLPSGASDVGFTLMGSNVMYVASESEYQAKFWAKETNTTGLYALMWNVDGVVEDGSVPVVVKTTGPITPSE